MSQVWIWQLHATIVSFLNHAGIQDERTRALAAQAFLGG